MPSSGPALPHHSFVGVTGLQWGDRSGAPPDPKRTNPRASLRFFTRRNIANAYKWEAIRHAGHRALRKTGPATVSRRRGCVVSNRGYSVKPPQPPPPPPRVPRRAAAARTAVWASAIRNGPSATATATGSVWTAVQSGPPPKADRGLPRAHEARVLRSCPGLCRAGFGWSQSLRGRRINAIATASRPSLLGSCWASPKS